MGCSGCTPSVTAKPMLRAGGEVASSVGICCRQWLMETKFEPFFGAEGVLGGPLPGLGRRPKTIVSQGIPVSPVRCGSFNKELT